METIVIIIILAVIFLLIARKIPAVSSEIKEIEAVGLGDGKKEEQKMVKFESPDAGARKRRQIKIGGIPKKEKRTKDRLTIEDVLIKADELIEKKEYEEAEKLLINGLEVDPHNPKIYNKLGIIYIEQENYGDAKEAFKTSLKYDKNNALTHNNLGLALFNQGRYVEAIEAYKKSIQLNSLIPHRYINLGLTYSALRQYDKALDSYKKALVLDKNNEDYERLIREVKDKIEEMKEE
uniref:Tetratricopeptide repeat protein n=1 Tax=candidate division CPR3 bacterium TaxID=2268181 RepID=A0A7C4R5N2_UNCC3